MAVMHSAEEKWVERDRERGKHYKFEAKSVERWRVA